MRTMSQLFSGLRSRLVLLVVLASLPPVVLTLYIARQDRQRQTAALRQRSQDMVKLAARKEAEMIAEKVRNALCHPYAIQEGRPAYHSTPSIGVTLFRGQEVAVDVLLKQADVALYQAKNAGRNAVRVFGVEG